jgi:hypothetical protein
VVAVRKPAPVLVALVAVVGLLGALTSSCGRPARQRPVFGVYAGPGAKDVAGAQDFASLVGVPIRQELDFASAADWNGVTGPAWLLQPHRTSGQRLEYSLPMMPEGTGYSLAACAAGDYDVHWTELAKNLVAQHLTDTIVRPGWEFNGTWYAWSAAHHVTDYINCFRHIVIAMRATSGQRFAFDWNPTLGAHAFPAEQAYPGDAYVDYVGVDVYDRSPRYLAGTTTAMRSVVWQNAVSGADGLQFWARFAHEHHKPLAIPEWGVTVLSDGEGGGDDAAFVDRMFSFMTTPANHVAYQQYFDVTSSTTAHALGNRFPSATAAYRSWARKLGH